MGFIDFIRRLLGTGHDKRPDYDKKVRALESRIHELRKEIERANREIKKLREGGISAPSFHIDPKSSDLEVKVFFPPKIEQVHTMKDLQKAREKQELERIKRLRQQIATSFDRVGILLSQEKVDEAENLLHGTACALQEVKDELLLNQYKELEHEISDARERIHAKLIRLISCQVSLYDLYTISYNTYHLI